MHFVRNEELAALDLPQLLPFRYDRTVTKGCYGEKPNSRQDH